MPEEERMFPDEMHNSDDGSDAMPEGMGEGDTPTDGVAAGRHAPSLQDMVMSRDQQNAQWNVVRHFVVSSMLPAEYLPMSILTKAELARQKRMVADMSQAQRGFIDVGYMMWWGTVGSVAIGGVGRRQAMDVIIGQQRHDMQQRGRGLSRYVKQSRDVNGTAAPSDE